MPAAPTCIFLAPKENFNLAVVLSATIRALGIRIIYPNNPEAGESRSLESTKREISEALFVIALISEEFKTEKDLFPILKFALAQKKDVLLYRTTTDFHHSELTPLFVRAYEIDVSDADCPEEGVPDLRLAAEEFLEAENERFRKRRIVQAILAASACVGLGLAVLAGIAVRKAKNLPAEEAAPVIATTTEPTPQTAPAAKKQTANPNSANVVHAAETYLLSHPLSAAARNVLESAPELAVLRQHLAKLETEPNAPVSERAGRTSRGPFRFTNGNFLHRLALQENPQLSNEIRFYAAAKALVAGTDLEKHCDEGFPPLAVACIFNADLASFFIDIGARVVNPKASYKFELDVLAARWNTTALLRKIEENRTGGLENFRKARVNEDLGWGVRLLHLAACAGNAESIAWLLENGADAKLTDNYGRTALHYLVTARQLLKRDGEFCLWDPNVQNYSTSVRRLIAAGTEVNACVKDRNNRSRKLGEQRPLGLYIPEDGRTALHVAAAAGDVRMVRRLLVLHADPKATNAAGETPIRFMRTTNWEQASASEKAEIENLLQNAR